MSTTTNQFNAAAIGVAGDPAEFAVEQERLQAYAAATNDDIAPHVAGEYAAPVFAIVPAFGAAAGATTKVIPGELIMMVVHGEQDFRFHKPILPGTTLVTTATPIGIHARSSGVTVCVKADTRDKATGDLLVEQYMTSFVRGAQTEASTGEAPPPHGFPAQLRQTEPVAMVEQTFDADQTFRYSEASGDPMPIHLDDDLAKAMGLPGIIIHGLCTMAFTSNAVIKTACPDDPRRLKRLAVRFSKVVQPGQTIATAIWSHPPASGHRTSPGVYVFETTSDAGQVVITDGLAEIA
jgi:acyl dehydratase